VSVPESLRRLVEELERLPGVGKRTAERLAHHLLRVPSERAIALADAIREVRERVRPCSSCRAPSETDPCRLCGDAGRDAGLLVVVESARDLAAFEAAGAYRGLYYVLGGRASPLDPASAEAFDVAGLVERVRHGVREVCLATNPDLEGDGTSLVVARALAGAGVRVTRLARGIPAGGQIEYQSASVLAEALEGRRAIDG
jgi:recombination protein RecR